MRCDPRPAESSAWGRGAALALAALLLATTPGGAQTGLPAQPFEAAKSNGALTATVVSNDATRFVVQADNGAVVPFLVDNSSSIPAGLVPGSRVTVRYDVLEGNQYRVSSVGIPKIPMDPGSTTEPPPTPPEESERTPTARAEASAGMTGPSDQGEPDTAEPASGEADAGAAQTDTPASDRSPIPRAPDAATPGPESAASDAGGRFLGEFQPGREALVIGVGLVFVALALGLLVLMRR